MKHQLDNDDTELDFDELPQTVSAQIEHLSRRWTDDEQRQSRAQRHALTRRRIEDWREERALRRAFEDEFDLD